MSTPPAMDLLATERWAEIDALFDAALDRPADERTAYLRAACGHDPALYHAVTLLLDRAERGERAFGEQASAFAARLIEEVGERRDDPGLAEGTRVGPYRIVRELGRGGMGTVYLAARADGAFEKAVALKLVKRGMDSDEVLRRFRAERQILAGLEHPHIARLYDGGVSADGRPYLVMELVEGEPITTYCDRHRLSVDARLALFVQVCRAVAHAHHSLVVHRDLKPGNVLVTHAASDEPASPNAQVKLLDFGIAKLLGEGEAGVTQAGLRPLTPEYAAPEQLRGEPVTTATDVYALGVLLYELLAGRRPFDKDRAGPAEALPDRPVPLPSAAITPAVASARGTSPERLRRRLRGDLDTVCRAALRAEPARRYPSADALRADLERHRAGLPVDARPDTAAYRARTFVARHRWGVGAAAAFVLLLGAAVVALAVEQRATARERDAAEEVAVFLEDVFAASDPFGSETERLDTLRAADLLARGARRAQRDLAGQPALQARLLTTIGGIYVRLSLHSEARPLLEQALQTRQRAFGPAHEAVAQTRHALAMLEQQEGHYDEAEAHLTSALAITRRAFGPEHPRTLAVLNELAVLYEDVARYREAEEILRELAAVRRRRLGERHPELATALHDLALVLRDQERYAEAEPPAREALAIQRAALGPEHPRIAATLNVLGSVLRNRGDLDGAEEAYRTSLDLRRRVLGDAHRETEIGRTHLAELLRDQGRLEEAAALYREILERTRRSAGEDHAGVAIITSLLANVLLDAQAYGEAEAAYRDALARMARALPTGHVRIARATAGLGACLTGQGRYPEAEAALLDARRQFEAGGHDPRRALERLVALYDQWGRPGEAARYGALLAAGLNARP